MKYLSNMLLLETQIRIATLNINDLTQQKLPIRLDEKDSQFIAMLIRKHVDNANVQTYIAPVHAAMKRARRVVGTIIIIYGEWASRIVTFTCDYTNMGHLTGTTLQAHHHKLLVLAH